MLKVFSTPVDASSYIPAFGTAKGASLISINYLTGEVVFSLIREDDSVSSIVNGITIEGVSEETVAAEIRAVVSGTA